MEKYIGSRLVQGEPIAIAVTGRMGVPFCRNSLFSITKLFTAPSRRAQWNMILIYNVSGSKKIITLNYARLLFNIEYRDEEYISWKRRKLGFLEK